jgi:hypothetical protein
MATKMPPPPDQAGDEHRRLDPDTDCGPSLVGLAVARLLVLAVVAGAVRLGHREWHTATLVLVVLGAAWVLGRVD